MSSFFEPDSSFLFDPHSQMEEVPTSFLSFSSFAALANIASSPWSLSSPDSDTKSHHKSEYFHPSGSDASTPPSSSDETNRFHALERSLEPVTPHFTSVGLFHTTSQAGSSKTSEDIWTSPRTPTPTLLSKASIESIAEVTSCHSTQSRLVSPSPLRTTSNPVLGSTYRPKKVKPVASMPALNEEESAYFEDVDSIFASLETGKNDSVQDDVLAEDFGWVFSDYGLGASSSGSGSSQGVVPADSTIFAAFQSDSATDNPFSTQGVDSLFGFSEPAPTFTIDPMDFMGSVNGLHVETRPSSSLGFGEGSGSLMSIPMGDMMSRSCSSDDMSQRSAPVQDPFSYIPQQTQTYYSTGDNIPYVVPHQQVMPPTPTQSRRPSKAMPRQGLKVQINSSQPTYRVASMGLPPTPGSASFDNMSSQQPLPIARNGRIPLSRSSGSSGSNESEIPMPPVVARAAAIVAMQEAKQEAERQAYRRQAASRRVNMAEASVLQPYAMNSRSGHITGWSGQGGMQYSMTQPMVTVHPPPVNYAVGPAQYSQPSHPSHRIHPPPHPGPSRPIARLPSTPTRSRKVSASPAKRTPSRKRVSESDSGGGFSWGETAFVNYTSADAEKLLTGVAPSGSQAKRKREEEAKAQEEMLGERKRSRSGECI